MALSGACLVCGCSGAVHRLPQVSAADLSLAQSEVRAAGPVPWQDASGEEVVAVLRRATKRIYRPAGQVCREMDVGVCDWKFRLSLSRAMNAAAWPHGIIVVNRGVVDYAANEEEVCLVIAHEMGHQAADHVAARRHNRQIGASLGRTLLGNGLVSVAVGLATGSPTLDGASVGARIGVLSFSKEQEREADYLAALILYRAGVDLDKARGMLVNMARLSRRMRTELLDTHPAGPERIAGWDRAVAEIRANNGRLPPRA
jgi:predicted Zn-dependent protease